ncbi:hypothetical protein LguiA_022457 [Lonicera macranthoides]
MFRRRWRSSFKCLKKIPNKDGEVAGAEPYMATRSTGLPPKWDSPSALLFWLTNQKFLKGKPGLSPGTSTFTALFLGARPASQGSPILGLLWSTTRFNFGVDQSNPRIGVTHPGIVLIHYSLNFGVLMGSEASEPPKGLVLN